MPTRLQAVERTLTRCLVCGSREVRTDEVVDRGLVQLNECPHCEYRWTRSSPPLAVAGVPGDAAEVPAAA